MNVDENTQADDPVGTVRVHPEDDRMSPTARRRIAVDASDYCGPYEGCRWQRLTGVGTGDGGCDPLHSRDVAGWPVQPLAEVAQVLGHPAVDGDLRERIVDAVLDVLAHGDVATQQEGSERLADVMLAIVRPVLERQAAEIVDHSRAAEIDEGTKAELAEENAGLCAEVARLAAELASERAVYADSPGDRLWHDADGTWWRRAEDGRLVRADAPPEVEQLARERDEAQQRVRLLETVASIEHGQEVYPGTPAFKVMAELAELRSRLAIPTDAVRLPDDWETQIRQALHARAYDISEAGPLPGTDSHDRDAGRCADDITGDIVVLINDWMAAPVSGPDTTPPSMPALAKIVYCGKTEGYTGVDCQLEAEHGGQPHEGRWIDPKNEDNWLFVQWPTDKARAEARQAGVAS